jgi:hypothetical protein
VYWKDTILWALLIDPLNSQVLVSASWHHHMRTRGDGGQWWTPYDMDTFTGYRYAGVHDHAKEVQHV